MKHTYSAGGIVLNNNGQILLINEGGDFWGVPKGRQEANESLLETAKREIKEEAGLEQLTLLSKLGTYERHPNILGKDDTRELKHITLYLFKTNHSDKLSNMEGNDACWLKPSEAITLLSHAKDRKFLESKLSILQALIERDNP